MQRMPPLVGGGDFPVILCYTILYYGTGLNVFLAIKLFFFKIKSRENVRYFGLIQRIPFILRLISVLLNNHIFFFKLPWLFRTFFLFLKWNCPGMLGMGVLSSIRRQWFQRTRSHVHVVPINNVYFDTLGKLSNGTISIIIKYDTWTIVRPFNCCYNVTLWFSI